MTWCTKFVRKSALLLIKIYQHTLSPDHGIFRGLTTYGCRFQPTCSVYGYQAVEKYGLIKGFGKIFKRIMRCHPFTKGGYDPLT